MINTSICLILMIILVAGCQSVKPTKQPESADEIVKALGTVTEGLTNQNISREDLKRLAVNVSKDPQTKTAVENINQALNPHHVVVKYCPIDGQRFDVSVDECPKHKVKLKLVE